MATNDGGPAFPRPASEDTTSGTLADGNDVIRHQDGMSLRDWFAGQAMAGYCANPEAAAAIPAGELEKHAFARWAYMQADAMLAAREGRADG